MGISASPELLAEGGEAFNQVYRSLTLRERQRLNWHATMRQEAASEGDLAMQLGFLRRELSRAWLYVCSIILVIVVASTVTRIALGQGGDIFEIWQLFTPVGALVGLGYRYLLLARARTHLSDRWERRERTLSGAL